MNFSIHRAYRAAWSLSSLAPVCFPSGIYLTVPSTSHLGPKATLPCTLILKPPITQLKHLQALQSKRYICYLLGASPRSIGSERHPLLGAMPHTPRHLWNY